MTIGMNTLVSMYWYSFLPREAFPSYALGSCNLDQSIPKHWGTDTA